MNPLRNKSLWLLCLLLCHAGSSLAERSDRGKPVHLEASSVSVDDMKQTSSFEGNVLLQQGTLSIQADKIVVVQDKEGYQHCTATGHLAHFRQKREAENEYVDGYGERIEYDTRTEVAEFFGQGRIKRDGDEVRGDHITYSTKTELFQVSGASDKSTGKPGSGRVTVVIQPPSKASDVAPAGAPLPIKPAATITEPTQ